MKTIISVNHCKPAFKHMNIIRYLKSKIFRLYIKMHEHTYEGKLKYLFINNHSKSLVIVFSGFNSDNTRVYNYIKSFYSIKSDKLFINDTWGYKGSYYWFENGKNEPEILTQGIISFFKKRGGYNHIYTAGSSKGGTCALYYGLLNQVTAVFAGACQYHVGNYLTIPAHYPIFKAMMFKNEDHEKDEFDVTEAKEILNLKLKNLIVCTKLRNTAIHLIYSKVEKQHTWQDDMADLVDDLRNSGFDCYEKEEFFLDHGEIGLYFSKYVNDFFQNKKV